MRWICEDEVFVIEVEIELLVTLESLLPFLHDVKIVASKTKDKHLFKFFVFLVFLLFLSAIS